MDLSFEKTNSAYMLFYEKKHPNSQCDQQRQPEQTVTVSKTSNDALMRSIWSDNIKFMNDKQILEHAYFSFVWQMCSYVPRGIICAKESADTSPSLTPLLLATKLGVSFFLEVYIHSRDKPQIIQWAELLTKYLNASTDACMWLVDHLCACTQSEVNKGVSASAHNKTASAPNRVFVNTTSRLCTRIFCFF